MYNPPTPSEFRVILNLFELTGSAAGKLVYAHSRTVRRWTGGDRGVSFPVLYTLLHRHCGLEITPENWRETFNRIYIGALPEQVENEN